MKTLLLTIAILGMVPASAGSGMLDRSNGTDSAVQGKAPGPSKDEIYFSLARRVNEQSDSPVSALVNALGEVIEVGDITLGDDGKATVIVKELSPSNARATNKSIRLVFAPAAEAKWKWESFEDNRRLYPVERLFPYAKDRLDRGRQMTVAAWAQYIDSMSRQGEAAAKVLETAKAILKSDPPQMNPLNLARASLDEAKKSGQVEVILSAYRELETAIEPVVTLGDNFSDLNANDAYLRLQGELKKSSDNHVAARKAYLDSVAAYNDDLRRLPFSLVAHGFEHTQIEAKIQPE
ncbi:MAG: LemA family protein [Acidobacteria bacterium]|nr:LemA family protein [Acidobacteriota bacterium]